MAPDPVGGREAECTCDVKPPIYRDGYGSTLGRYSIYMTFIEDRTRFDLACPFHGREGSMVVKICV